MKKLTLILVIAIVVFTSTLAFAQDMLKNGKHYLHAAGKNEVLSADMTFKLYSVEPYKSDSIMRVTLAWQLVTTNADGKHYVDAGYIPERGVITVEGAFASKAFKIKDNTQRNSIVFFINTKRLKQLKLHLDYKKNHFGVEKEFLFNHDFSDILPYTQTGDQLAKN